VRLMINSFQELYNQLQGKPARRVVLVGAGEPKLIGVLKEAARLGLIEKALLLGNALQIEELVQKTDLTALKYEVIDREKPAEQIKEALCRLETGEVDLLMKGIIDTSTLMKGILDPELGLREEGLISHITVHELPFRNKLLFITDPSINIEPGLEQKVALINNAVQLTAKLGISEPRVAVLSFAEKVNPRNRGSYEAAILSMMSKRGQIKGAVVDGPLALDLALNEEAAMIKNIESPVAGKADILLVNNLEVGNVLAKSLSFIGRFRGAGVLMGVKKPVVLTSRSATRQEKLDSLAFALYLQ